MGPRDRTVRTEDGQVLAVPEGWALLPPGDALLTRRVKAGGPCWTVSEKVGRRMMSRGVWAPAERIAKAQASVEATRASPEHARQLAASRSRRERAQEAYVASFDAEVRAFLAFHPRHAGLEAQLAERVTAHATPVGSGTVARTERIPVAERAEAAVIAWLRHQTTAYDHMAIPRVKGKRREVRRKLAARSRELLDVYRRGDAAPESCPLVKALEGRAGGGAPGSEGQPARLVRSPPPSRAAASPRRPGSGDEDTGRSQDARGSLASAGEGVRGRAREVARAASMGPPGALPPAQDDELAKREARQRAVRERMRKRGG